jgi:hypothetical protein
VKVSKPFIILLVASVLFGIYLVFFTGKSKVVPVAPGKPSASQPAPPAVLPTEAAGNKPSSGEITWGRDPFARPEFFNKDIENPTKAVKSALRLEAILEGDKGRVAIIDKQVLVRGDAIGNERIQEIGRDRVVLIGGGSRRLLLLGEPRGEETAAKRKVDGENK